MIHQLLVIDREKSVGLTLYDNNQLRLQSDLLIGLVQALMVLGEELGPVKGSLREAELGKYQISILSKDHIIYVAVQDTYDSEPFTKQIIERVVFQFHNLFASSNLTVQLKNEIAIKEKVAELLTTMKFPVDKIEEARNILLTFAAEQSVYIDTLFIADLDDGIIDIGLQPKSETIIRLLMEILSEIPFERHWIGQTKLQVPLDNGQELFENELWLIYRVMQTDFCVMGRAYYQSDIDREHLIHDLELLTERLDQLI